MADTTYIVLRRTSTDSSTGHDGWDVVGESDGADAPWIGPNAEAAIKKALSGNPNPHGTYVAVPARSWKPVQVEAVQTTILKLT